MAATVRVGLTGPSSTGKTSIAREFAAQTGVPFLAVDTTTELRKFGYGSHPALVSAGPAANREFQLHLIRKRVELLDAHDSFITDRTPLDSLVYYCMEAMHKPHPDDDRLQAEVFAACARYDALVLVRYGSLPLEDNGVRTHSDLYHRMTDLMFRYLADRMEMATGRVVQDVATADGTRRLQQVAVCASVFRHNRAGTPDPFAPEEVQSLRSAYV
jgi:adenylate kinase family enzyme